MQSTNKREKEEAEQNSGCHCLMRFPVTGPFSTQSLQAMLLDKTTSISTIVELLATVVEITIKCSKKMKDP